MTVVKTTRQLSEKSLQEIQNVVTGYEKMGLNKYQIKESLAKKYCCGVSLTYQNNDAVYVLHLIS